MATYAKRLEAAEGATKHLPGPDDPARFWTPARCRQVINEILGREAIPAGRYRDALAVFNTLCTADIRLVLEKLHETEARQRADGKQD